MRVASFIADPTPAMSTGTAPMTASVVGAMQRPMPAPNAARLAATIP
jgi:hypothetical protein